MARYCASGTDDVAVVMVIGGEECPREERHRKYLVAVARTYTEYDLRAGESRASVCNANRILIIAENAGLYRGLKH
jgi:hypothetical protein